MAMLTREQLLGLSLPSTVVNVPELGGAVRVRAISVVVLDETNAEYLATKDDPNAPDLGTLQLQRCLVDDEGMPLLAKEDMPRLREIVGFKTWQKLCETMLKLSNPGSGEESGKNSETTQGDGSSTD